MIQVRESAVAGLFYPAEPDRLRDTLRDMLESVPAASGPAPKALVVPHAGYIYSGAVAAAAYAQLLPHRNRYHRVVLLGPAHRVPVRGLASSSARAFGTPLGEVTIDHEALTVCGRSDVRQYDAGHQLEHCLEVQLPFLQFVLGGFLLVPLVVGDAAAESVAEIIDLLWDGPETLIVISSDLSHYLGYERAQARDQATCRSIKRMDASQIDHDDACGATPLAGLLICARRRGLEIETLALCNSGDTAGDKQHVVGYGAWLLREPCK